MPRILGSNALISTLVGQTVNAAATLTSPTADNGTAPRMVLFNAQLSCVTTPQSGTLFIEGSVDGTTWFRLAQTAVVGTDLTTFPTRLTIPVTTRYLRANYTNTAGVAATGVALFASLTGA